MDHAPRERDGIAASRDDDAFASTALWDTVIVGKGKKVFGLRAGRAPIARAGPKRLMAAPAPPFAFGQLVGKPNILGFATTVST